MDDTDTNQQLPGNDEDEHMHLDNFDKILDKMQQPGEPNTSMLNSFSWWICLAPVFSCPDATIPARSDEANGSQPHLSKMTNQKQRTQIQAPQEGSLRAHSPIYMTN